MASTIPKPELFLLTDSTSNTKVEVSTIGASITRVLFPSLKNNNFSDDVVLHCENYADASCVNEVYFGAIVGRVANRIRHGQFKIEGQGSYQLPQNNGVNCLHGGGIEGGFSHRKYTGVRIGPNAVKFELVSLDGDQGFPATIKVTIMYTLRDRELVCDMSAGLEDVKEGPRLSTPINLAQHSYFNLAGHDSACGILSHTLSSPCIAYTPTDSNAIPTREVRLLEQETTMRFDKRMLSDALIQFGTVYGNLSESEAMEALETRCGKSKLTGDVFGFDHNYVVNQSESNISNSGGGLYVAGILEHNQSGRRMTVSTDAPGVQIYTSNYLDESIVGKNGTLYKQWQGICLETQSYPNSIGVVEEEEFSKGSCFILTPDGENYKHRVSYKFEHVL